jgi:hypothetical protein
VTNDRPIGPEVEGFLRSRVWKIMRRDMEDRLKQVQENLESRDTRDPMDIGFLKGEALTLRFMLRLPQMIANQSKQIDAGNDESANEAYNE